MTTIVLTVLNAFRETAILRYQDALERELGIMITVTTLGAPLSFREVMMAVLPIFKDAQVNATVMINVLLVLNASNETTVKLSPVAKVQGMEKIGITATILAWVEDVIGGAKIITTLGIANVVGRCDWWCQDNHNSWDSKCGWKECYGCNACSVESIDFECGVNQVLKEVRAVTSDCTNGDVRYNYVCSKIADGNESKVNNYQTISSFTESTGSVRCGPGDLLTGWGSGASQCIQRKEGYEALKGNQVACGWEASTNGEAPTIGGNSVNCGRICDSRSDCNSFTVCGETCYFTAEAYDAEVTRVCRDDRGSCTSYRNVNFVL